MAPNLNEKLDQLANFQAQRDVIHLQKQALIDEVLTPEIKARLEEIEAEFAEKVEVVDANITALEAEIKAEVVRCGASVKGTFLMAIWNKGRVSWDTKAMDGYALSHPEILSFRKEGEPYVSFRKV